MIKICETKLLVLSMTSEIKDNDLCVHCFDLDKLYLKIKE